MTKHVNPAYQVRIAIAPYNFVPLPEKVLTVEPASFAGFDTFSGYSGYFECTLTAHTHLYIRGMTPSAEFDQQLGANAMAPAQRARYAKFFSDAQGRPAIPGSSLRGLIRTLVEIVSYSKMTRVMRQRMAYRAVDTSSLADQYRKRIMAEFEPNRSGDVKHYVPRVRGGYLRRRGSHWYIQPAQDVGGTTWCRAQHDDLEALPASKLPRIDGAARNAHRIYFLPGPYEYQDVRGGFLRICFSRALRINAANVDGLLEGALLISGPMKSKKSEAIIFPPDPARTTPDSWLKLSFSTNDGVDLVDLVAEYRFQVTPWQERNFGRDGALIDGQPVFYLPREQSDGADTALTGPDFFGHTQMMRVPYRFSPGDLVPEALRRDEDLDLAEAMFGFVRAARVKGRRSQASAGRVYFSDAPCIDAAAFETEPLVPKILSSPKPTTFQHYLTQAAPDDAGTLLNYDDEGKTVIRGHKLFWHKDEKWRLQNAKANPELANDKATKQTTVMQPARPGATFRFIVRFENLTKEALGALAWVLRCSMGAENAHRLKLGMGKPHGLGAVQIDARAVLIDRDQRYRSLFSENGSWASCEGDAVQAEQVIAEAMRSFEAWVLGDAAVNPGARVTKLGDLPRLRELMTLLRYPGPDSAHTRYMEIELPDRTAPSGKRNEYRTRPVLPTPGAVGLPARSGNIPVDTRFDATPRPIRKSEPRFQEAPTLAPLPDVREEVSALAKDFFVGPVAKGPVVDQVLEATVLAVSPKEYRCDVGAGERRLGLLPVDEKRGLRVGDKVLVRVKKVNASGTFMVTTKGFK